MRASSFAYLTALVVSAAEGSKESTALYPTLSPRSGFDAPTTPPSGVEDLPLAAVHSKMGELLLERREMETLEPSAAPSVVPSAAAVVSPTTSPATASSILSSASPSPTASPGAGVRCDAVDESTPCRIIELPYFFELETSLTSVSGVVDSLKSVEQSLLKTLSNEVLNCNGEQIRRSLNEEVQPKVVAAYLSDDTIINEVACPANLLARSCHLVEGKIAVVIQGGGGADDGAIVSDVYQAVMLTFLTLANQGDRIIYVGNDPLALTSEHNLLSHARADLVDESDNLALFVFVSFICGSLLGVVALMYTCSLVRKKARGKKKQQGPDVESGPFPMTFVSTPAASCDDAELGDEPDWCRLVYDAAFSSASLRKVIEDYGLRA